MTRAFNRLGEISNYSCHPSVLDGLRWDSPPPEPTACESCGGLRPRLFPYTSLTRKDTQRVGLCCLPPEDEGEKPLLRLGGALARRR